MNKQSEVFQEDIDWVLQCWKKSGFLDIPPLCIKMDEDYQKSFI